MNEHVSSIGIEEFLKDFRNQSTTEIFESGKQKDEIIQIAKAKMGIDLKNNTDLAGFKTIYTFANIANGNKARLPKEQLLKALPTIIGKPVNINHIRNYVVGYYIDYRYIESENKVVAYGIFFKSNFGNEWDEAKELIKSNQLGTSHEVWCPKEKRRYLGDGTYEAYALEFAGGALIYRNKQDWQNPGHKIDTAFKGCDVLELAMHHMDKNVRKADLIIASINVPIKKSYRLEDLIVANDAQAYLKKTETEIKQKVEAGAHQEYQKTPAPKVETPLAAETPAPTPAPVVPTVPKVKCDNCGNQWETQAIGELQCGECKAIVDRSGKMLYPPQVISFNFREPNTGSGNWRLLKDSNQKALIKNMDSNKVYELTFAQNTSNDELLGKLKFVYLGTASCPQCGKTTNFSTVSNVEDYGIDCPRCELHYTQNIKKQTTYRKIKSYRDVTDGFKNGTLSDESPIGTKELMVSSFNPDNEHKVLEIASMEPEKEEKVTLEVSSVTDPGITLEVASSIKVDSTKANYFDKAKRVIKKMKNKIRHLKLKTNLNTPTPKLNTELETAKIKADADQKIEFYKTNAVELVKRREFLKEFGDHLSDEKIMDDDSYAKARLEKENALLKASLANGTPVVGDKTPIGRSDAQITGLKSEINDKAFKIWMK